MQILQITISSLQKISQYSYMAFISSDNYADLKKVISRDRKNLIASMAIIRTMGDEVPIALVYKGKSYFEIICEEDISEFRGEYYLRYFLK